MTLGLSLFDLVTVMVVVWGMFHVKHYCYSAFTATQGNL